MSGKKIIEGLKDAVRHARGEPVEVRETRVAISEAGRIFRAMEAVSDSAKADKAEIARLQSALAQAERERDRLKAAISWALGEGDSNFGDNIEPRAPPYWWRKELRLRSLQGDGG